MKGKSVVVISPYQMPCNIEKKYCTARGAETARSLALVLV